MPSEGEHSIFPSHFSLTMWLLQSVAQLQGMLSDCFIDHGPAFFSTEHSRVEFSMVQSFCDPVNHPLIYWSSWDDRTLRAPAQW